MRTRTLLTLFLSITAMVAIVSCSDSSSPGLLKPAEGSIAGTAFDADSGNPLQGVHISVLDSSGSEVATTNTDTSGQYSITLSAGQSYDLEFSLAWYNTKVYTDIPVQENEIRTLDSVLQHNTDGIISGNAIDAVSGNPLPGVHISVLDPSGLEVASTDTDAGGLFSITLASGQSYDVEFSLASYYTEVYRDVPVRINENNILEAVLQINSTVTGTGVVTGTIRDAQTGNPIPDATLNFRFGINVKSGTIVDSTLSDAFGNFVIDTLTTGNYTCEIIITGYDNAYATVLVLGGQSVLQSDISVSKTLQTGETRIVLTWGSTPNDLDAHITGPTANNSVDRFHFYFGNKGDFTLPPYVGLDVDDVDQYGPETVTIAQQFQGTYRYSVHDFSTYNLNFFTDSTVLANSGAKVTVYQGNAAPRVFNVPPGIGVLWTVFELNGTDITPINTMGDTADHYSIQGIGTANSDAHLFRDLPSK